MINRLRRKASGINDTIVEIGLILLSLSAIIIPISLPIGIIAGITGIILFSFLMIYLWFFNIE